MNFQQAVPSKSSANGLGRRRVEKEGGNRQDYKTQAGKSNTGRSTASGDIVGGFGSPSCDRLIYLTTFLIGHPVEVQVKNGSVYAGIYHATNTEKDFGVILKMARMVKDGTLRGQKAAEEFLSRPPSKTLIIPGKELVQVTAKDVAVTRDVPSNEFQHGKQQDLMLDSYISQSHHVDLERELAPWVPDEEDPHYPELDNIFDNPRNRSWDQFETNKALFGVKSTFNEELYTTKLERGPRMRELEKEAMRLAREIESEDTKDLHLAEERGIQLQGSFDIDEETRFSSVYRGTAFDDSGFEEEEDILLDSHNTETFGASAVSKTTADLTGRKNNDVTRASSSSSLVEASLSSLHISGPSDHTRDLASEHYSEHSIPLNLLDEQASDDDGKVSIEKQMHTGDSRISKSEEGMQSQGGNIVDLDEGGITADASLKVKPHDLSKGNENTTSADDSSKGLVYGKTSGETQSLKSSVHHPGSSRSSSSERVGVAPASTCPVLSPSSSFGSLSSEKSTLNPHAKEFRLNPNAKSFKPTVVRPPSPASDGSFYYPTNVSHIQSMPVGYGIGPSLPGHQPVIFNPQVAPQQAYFHPNGPQYGQHMLLGQPRQVVYMPGYQPEMQYKG